MTDLFHMKLVIPLNRFIRIRIVGITRGTTRIVECIICHGNQMCKRLFDKK